MVKPSGLQITGCAIVSALAMATAIYFGGTGRVPLAMLGTAIFVLMGGLTFELARRRSL